jgi:hypothetical protein
MPVGVPEPAGTDATVALTVTVSPIAEGFGDELTVVVDPCAWTFCTKVVLPLTKLASPL